jgi:hypothetical protein
MARVVGDGWRVLRSCRPHSTLRRPPSTSFRPWLETLEDRTLPSTIVWINRGSATSDSDNFNAVFGANAATARADVDAALAAWQGVIQNFNYADGTNTLSLTILMNLNDPSNDAEAVPGLRTDWHGRPEAGEVLIGTGPYGHGGGYFLDPTPINSSAFQGTIVNPYVRDALPGSPAYGLADFFTVVLLETTHTLGLNTDPNELFQQNQNGYLHSTGQPDTVDSPGTLFTFNGPDVRALFTSDNGDSTNTGMALHTARPGNSYTDPATGFVYTGAFDSDNALYYESRRMLPSLMDALVLKDAYGYTIAAPASFTPAPFPPALSPLAPILVTGADAGGGPEVEVYNGATGALEFGFYAYDPRFAGGVRVATGDFNGDGVPDIVTAPGPSGGPDIRIFDGRTGALLREFMAYSPDFLGGVNVAVGDVNGDGIPDIITGADAGGGPQVKVFSGKDLSLLCSFYAYDPHFSGGVRVAAGDVNGDGYADIITGAGPGGGPHVEVFSGKNGAQLQSFMAYASSFTGGVYVAAGDVNGDGKADIITGAGAGGAPQVNVYNGANGALLESFLAYDSTFTGGVRVGAAELQGNGLADILTASGPGASPIVRAFAGITLAVLDNFYAYDPYFQGGVYVGGANEG